MTALWIGLGVVAYLLVGWVGAITWMRAGAINPDSAAERGMSVVFGPVIGFWFMVIGLCDGIGWVGRMTATGLGKLVPRGD